MKQKDEFRQVLLYFNTGGVKTAADTVGRLWTEVCQGGSPGLLHKAPPLAGLQLLAPLLERQRQTMQRHQCCGEQTCLLHQKLQKTVWPRLGTKHDKHGRNPSNTVSAGCYKGLESSAGLNILLPHSVRPSRQKKIIAVASCCLEYKTQCIYRFEYQSDLCSSLHIQKQQVGFRDKTLH